MVALVLAGGHVECYMIVLPLDVAVDVLNRFVPAGLGAGHPFCLCALVPSACCWLASRV